MPDQTTYVAIRDKQEKVIKALSPRSMSQVRFQPYLAEQDFREWAEANPQAALRVFSISDISEPEPPLASSGVEVEEVATQLVEVAYPKSWGRYGKRNMRDAEKVILEDRDQIDDAIGLHGAANYISGQHATRAVNRPIEDDGGEILFLAIEYETTYHRSVT